MRQKDQMQVAQVDTSPQSSLLFSVEQFNTEFKLTYEVQVQVVLSELSKDVNGIYNQMPLDINVSGNSALSNSSILNTILMKHSQSGNPWLGASPSTIYRNHNHSRIRNVTSTVVSVVL